MCWTQGRPPAAQLSLCCAEMWGRGRRGRVSQALQFKVFVFPSEETQILPGVFCKEWKLSSTTSPTGFNCSLRYSSFLCLILPANSYSSIRSSLIFQNQFASGYLLPLNPPGSGHGASCSMPSTFSLVHWLFQTVQMCYYLWDNCEVLAVFLLSVSPKLDLCVSGMVKKQDMLEIG